MQAANAIKEEELHADKVSSLLIYYTAFQDKRRTIHITHSTKVKP